MRLRITVLTLATAFGAAALDGGGDTAFAGRVWGDEPRAAKQDFSWVAKRIEAWQPNAQERAFDQIGWAGNLREALRLGKQHGRPVFLFTYDGASLSCYRC